MCFSKHAAKSITEDEKNTVRANQGGAFPHCRVYVTSADDKVIDLDCLQIVALSRHTDSLGVAHDGSSTAVRFVNKVNQGESWKEEHVSQSLVT